MTDKEEILVSEACMKGGAAGIELTYTVLTAGAKTGDYDFIPATAITFIEKIKAACEGK